VVGALRGFQPHTMVDVGSGRGTFLWPMMDALPYVIVTSIETHPVYAKHTIFYDQLPHYFLEFDPLDLERDVFLDTPSRHELLAGSPVASVPVLARGEFDRLADLQKLLARAGYRTGRPPRPGHRARVHIVHLEAPPERLHEQNRRRREPVPRAVIDKLVGKWSVPDLTEAHALTWVADETRHRRRP